MELKNCKVCGKLFQSNGFSTMCMSCAEQDEKDFALIREFLRERPGASIYDVATNLDMTVSKIKRYLREDRIEIVEKNNTFLTCEVCGRPIRSGRYCDECYMSMRHDCKGVAVAGMHKTEIKFNYLSQSTTGLRKAAAH